jgi:protein-tyrosine phosphatase
LEQTWNFIDTALSSHPRWVVLVHCASGISRSVALVCHYLMRKEYLSFQDSIQFIRSRHPAAEPNSSFVEQLKLVDVQLCKQRALQQPVNSSISVHECLPSSATAHRQTSRALQHPCE